MLTFTDDPPRVYEVPRLEDHQIDDLFYQEDEIGEMRHTAFMIECGLEEDPPDGPDVPPIPWKFSPGSTPAEAPGSLCEGPPPPKRHPLRTASMDDIDELESELGVSPKRPEPRRKLVVAKSGTLHGMRKAVEKSHSADNIEENGHADAPARRAAPVSRNPKKMMKAKSGSLHGLREAARKTQELNKDLPVGGAPSSPAGREPRRSRLVVTKSGALHGMRKAAEKAIAEDDTPESPSKSPFRRSKLVVTKSGTLHGMRAAAAKAKTAAADSNDSSPIAPKRNSAVGSSRRSSDGSLQGSLIKGSNHALKKKKSDRKIQSDTSDEDSFSEFGGSDSDVESEVSLDTDEDVPKSPIKKKAGVTTSHSKSPSKTSKVVTNKVPEKATDSAQKERKRVFKNGKLVWDDGAPDEKAKNSDSGSTFSAAMDRFKNGSASPADLLRNMQARPAARPKSTPTKSASIAAIAVPPAFQQKTTESSTRIRPGKIKIPSKAKSVSAMDIPPAFRTGLGK